MHSVGVVILGPRLMSIASELSIIWVSFDEHSVGVFFARSV